MSASTSSYIPLVTEDAWGDPAVVDGNEAGASGNSSSNSMTLSTGGLIAIITVVVIVILIGTSTAALFFIANKREWTVRETIRRSTRKVAMALTPRRSEFPRSAKASTRSSDRECSKLADDVPPSPRLRPEDLEKGSSPSEIKSKGQKFGQK